MIDHDPLWVRCWRCVWMRRMPRVFQHFPRGHRMTGWFWCDVWRELIALPVPLPNDRMQKMTGHFRRRKCAADTEAEGTLSRCQNWVKMLRAAVSSAVSSWEVLHSRRACGLVQGSVSRLEYSSLYLFWLLLNTWNVIFEYLKSVD